MSRSSSLRHTSAVFVAVTALAVLAGCNTDTPSGGTGAPKFSAMPAPATVDEGSPAVFSVTVGGTPAPTLQWERQSAGGAWTAIAGATSASWTTPATTAADDGARFRATATNAAGSVSSDPATLTVRWLHLTTEPADATVADGADAQFSVVADASPAATFRWESRPASGGDWTAIAGAAADHLVLARRRLADDGTSVRCVVASAEREVTTRAATLRVLPVPVAPVITAPSVVTAGEPGLVASVPAQEGVSFHWTLEGGTLTSGQDTPSITFTAGAAGTATLGCIATGGEGTLTTSALVTIVDPPVQPDIVAPAFVTAGTAGWTASVLAQDGITYEWRITGGTLVAGNGTPSVEFAAWATGSLTLELTARNAAGAALSDSATVAVVPAPAVPVITAPAAVTAGDTGLSASVPAQEGVVLSWSIQGGTLSGGADTASVAFEAGSPGTLVLRCTATNAAGATAESTASVLVAPAPQVPAISAPAFVTVAVAGMSASTPAQAGIDFSWTVTGGTITAGAGTPAVAFRADAAGEVTLTCTARNAAGATREASAKVTAVAAPVRPVIDVLAVVTTGASGRTASVPAQAGVTFEWSIDNGTITSGAGTDTVTFTPGSVGMLVLECVARNAAGTASAPGTATVTVAPAPDTPVVTAPAAVAAGATGLVASVQSQPGVTYAWSITGGTALAGTDARLLSFEAGAPGTIDLSCTVTNSAGGTATGAATIQVVKPAAISAFSPNHAIITAGDSVTFTATFDGDSGVIMPGNLPIVSGGSVTTLPASTATWTLTVTDLAGGSASRSVTVEVVDPPVITEFSSPKPWGFRTGTGTTVRAVFQGGDARIEPGPIIPVSGVNVAVRPPAATRYTLTVTNAAGKSATSALVLFPSQTFGMGRDFTVAISPAGQAFSCGEGNFGQLGVGTSGNGAWRTTPQIITSLGTNLVSVSSGYEHALALKSDGTVWGWGHNALGEVGDGTQTQRTSPVQLTALATAAQTHGPPVAISAGLRTSLALMTDGTVFVWGDNNWSVRGNNTGGGGAVMTTPVEVPNLTGVIAIAAGEKGMVALKSNGTAVCWGMGLCETGAPKDLLTNVGGIAMTGPQIVLLRNDGTVWKVLYKVAIKVDGLSEVIAVASARDTFFALKSDGSLWAWGSNTFGELGNGTSGTGTTTVPAAVPNLSGVEAVATGYNHAFVLKSDSTIWGWGANWGQFCNGTSTASSVPILLTQLAP
ncbi:MAG: hypothetical protein QM765_45625 [Myxococcales bacterium]